MNEDKLDNLLSTHDSFDQSSSAISLLNVHSAQNKFVPNQVSKEPGRNSKQPDVSIHAIRRHSLSEHSASLPSNVHPTAFQMFPSNDSMVQTSSGAFVERSQSSPFNQFSHSQHQIISTSMPVSHHHPQNMYSGLPNVIMPSQIQSQPQMQFPYEFSPWNQMPLSPVHPSQPHPIYQIVPSPVYARPLLPMSDMPGLSNQIVYMQVPYMYPSPAPNARPLPPRQQQTSHDKVSTALLNAAELDSSTMPTVADIRGKVFHYSKDQVGCRLLQKCVDSRSSELLNLVVEECLAVLFDVAIDCFGNYLFQKIFEYSNESTRAIMLQTLHHNLFRASLDLHGTRSVQKIIEICAGNPAHVSMIIDALSPYTASLCVDRNANHVIQKCLNRFRIQDSKFIIIAVTNSCFDICTHRHGCCVVQRSLDACRDSNGCLSDLGLKLVDQIVMFSIVLMQVSL